MVFLQKRLERLFYKKNEKARGLMTGPLRTGGGGLTTGPNHLQPIFRGSLDQLD